MQKPNLQHNNKITKAKTWEEEAFIEAIDNQLEESWQRNILGEMLLKEELDSSREWLEVEGIFEDI